MQTQKEMFCNEKLNPKIKKKNMENPKHLLSLKHN